MVLLSFFLSSFFVSPGSFLILHLGPLTELLTGAYQSSHHVSTSDSENKIIRKQPWPVRFWLVGHHPTELKVASSIPSQVTCQGCGFGPRSGSIWEATDWCFSLTSMFLSLSFSLLPLSLKISKWNLKKILLENNHELVWRLSYAFQLP